jgi:uncharacterized protein YjiS (DUF1127 family)
MPYARSAQTARHGRAAIGLARFLQSAGPRLVRGLVRRQELARQRRRLVALDEHLLKDIGITRADANREGSRLFWDAHGIDWSRWP